MTDGFILSRIYEDSTFQVGPYRVPKIIPPKKPGPLINLRESRQSQLIRNQTNPNNQGFEIFLVRNPDLPECIRELPIIPPEESQKNFYLLDYFFPTIGLAIELDSKTYHQKSKDQEKSKDLELLGMDVIRVYGFWDPVQRKNLEENMRKIILGRKESKIPTPICYSSEIIKNFRKKHKKALEILETKPMSGVNQNLYILDSHEMEECRKCLEDLKIL